MNSSTVIWPVSLNLEVPVGTGVMYSRMFVKVEYRRLIGGSWFEGRVNKRGRSWMQIKTSTNIASITPGRTVIQNCSSCKQVEPGRVVYRYVHKLNQGIRG